MLTGKRHLWMLVAFLGLLALALIVASCSQKAPEPAAGGDTGSTTTEPTEPAATGPALVPLVEQLKAHGHWTFFSERLEVTAKGEGHYGDSCIGCHSATARLDDPQAVVADFLPGGKYESDREGISCRVCHTFDKTRLWTLVEEDPVEVCATCHTGSIREGRAVHHPQGEFFKGADAIGVKGTPSPKLAKGFSCYTCHVTNQLDHDFSAPTPEEIAARPECIKCHESLDKIKEEMEGIQAEIEGLLAELTPRLETAQAKVAEATDQDGNINLPDDAIAAFNAFVPNITFVEADASKGIHNPDYARRLLEDAKAKLDVFEAAVK